MVKAGVIGATGYTGEEIVKILARHRKVKLTVLQAIVEKEAPIADIFPYLTGSVDIVCTNPNLDEALKADILFLALPHKVSMTVAPKLLKKGKKVIDLSADYRLPVETYETWYGVRHTDSGTIARAVYGLPELGREKIKTADLIANPGCYPTGALLGIVPAASEGVIDTRSIIVDAKSGASGAGRKAHIALSFSEVNENMKAYKIDQHQHKPEINMVLGRVTGAEENIVFVPHLSPLNRGILSTIYADLKKKVTSGELVGLYKKFYKDEPFVTVMGEGLFPALHNVQFTNACHIGICVTGKKLVAVTCIDNLLKGAAGQAVQNMNIMCGFDETEGLV